MLPGESEESDKAPVLRGACLLIVGYYSIHFFTAGMLALGETSTFIHLINLVFHEAGHVIFGLFGNRMLHVAGGSIMQCLVPLVLCVLFYWKNQDAFAAGLGLWWLGQNLVDCAPYINDARLLQLTLIGGRTGSEVEGHDWEYILTTLNLLNRDIYISRDVLFAGRLIMAAGLAWSLADLIRAVIAKRKNNAIGAVNPPGPDLDRP